MDPIQRPNLIRHLADQSETISGLQRTTPMTPQGLPVQIVGELETGITDQTWVKTDTTGSFIEAFRMDFMVTAPWLFLSFQLSETGAAGTTLARVMVGPWNSAYPSGFTELEQFTMTSPGDQWGRIWDLEEELAEPLIGEVYRVNVDVRRNTAGTGRIRMAGVPLLLPYEATSSTDP